MLKSLEKLRTKQSEKGFTIIEVMIVLAIAGLIILIVFLAVPALQRSSRNTQRKTDVGLIGQAVSTFATDNQGTLPTTATVTNGQLSLSGPTGSGESATGDAKLGFYTNVTITTTAPSYALGHGQSLLASILAPSVEARAGGGGGGGGGGAAAAVDTNAVVIVNAETCSGNAPTATGANNKDFAIMYELESSGNGVQQCQAS